MKVLITGCSGQLGRALIQTVPAHAVVMARTRADLDIGDRHATARCIQDYRPDVIVNAAAYTAVDRAESERELAHRVNAQGPAHLAVAAHETDSRLIHISTDYVFDGDACVPYKPDSATNPLSVYGTTKRHGEIAVLDALGARCVVLRTAWLYAPTGHNFVRTMLRQMSEKVRVRVVADQIGTPTSARSLARTVWRIVAEPQLAGTHHWTDAGVASWYDFAIAIAEEGVEKGLLPHAIEVSPIASHEYATAVRRPCYSVLDTSSLRHLAITPVHWRTQLRAVLEELKHG